MSANSQVEALPKPQGKFVEPLYFKSGDEHLFGWLHRPYKDEATNLGLVICNPFGHEAICSHRSVRAFAEAAAAVGFPSLRFDYRGTGDSSDIRPERDQIGAWTQDVVAAVSELRCRTGVHRVCILGFRLGALLAALAARECEGACGLMVISPIVTGRRYLKELQITRLAGQVGPDVPNVTGASAENRADGESTSFEVSGYFLSPATLTKLDEVDLETVAEVPAPRLLIIDSEHVPTARKWSELLDKAGAEVRYRVMPGTVEMLIRAPQFAIVPRHMITAMQQWLLSFLDAKSTLTNRTPSRFVAGRIITPKSVMTLRSVGLPAPTLTERAVRFGPDDTLFGIVTEPPNSDQPRRAVIFLNTGVDHHIGASRLYVSLARKWGARGYVALRMDLAGIGDSATRPGNQDDDVFPNSALADIASAIDCLEQSYEVSEISLIGLCSGAYHALRAAAAGIRVNRILMINPQNYFWKEGASLSEPQLADVVRNRGLSRKQLLSATTWRRLFQGEVNLYRTAKICLQRLSLSITFFSRGLARRLRIRLKNDLGRELEEIAERGVSISFVFAPGELGIDLLKLEGGSSVSRLGKRCRVHILKRGDHVFSNHDSRQELEIVLNDELFDNGQLTGI